MATRRAWTRSELILAMNLYCQLPFGKFDKGNSDVIALAAAIDRTPSSVAMKLCNLASLDPFHQERGVKGLSGASQGDRSVWQEFHDDWDCLATESEELREELKLPNESKGSQIANSDKKYSDETESTATVKIRRGQQFFRRSVLASYESKCCITSIAVPELLIASHILPWGTHPASRTDPRNGLCLSRLHDAAFDQGLMTLDDEFRVVLSRRIRATTTNSVMRDSFLAFEGKPIQLPSRFRPEKAFLQEHQQNIYKDA